MKGKNAGSKWLVIAAFSILIGMTGCGSGASTPSNGQGNQSPPPPSIVVTVSPTSATVQAGQSQQFTATVQNDPANEGVTWSLPNYQCSGTACITIDATGKLSVPANFPIPMSNLEVAATSVADSKEVGTASLNVTLAPTGVVVSPAEVTVLAGGVVQFLATVSPGSGTNQAVTWSVYGSGCSGAACGVIDANGTFTAPASAPDTPIVTVTATSVGDPTKSGSATVLIGTSAPNNARLSGQYAFLVSGTDGEGQLQAVGSFTADGNGNITAGTEDVIYANPYELGFGFVANASFIGTYAVGPDNRGSVTLISVGSDLLLSSFSFALSDFSSAVAGRGSISFYYAAEDNLSSAEVGTGILVKQDPTAFSTTAIQGSYAFGLGGERSAAAGRFTANSGSLSDGEIDYVDNTDVETSLVNQPFTGSYSVDSKGRGTISLAIPGSPFSNFVFYVASAHELLVLDEDLSSDGSGPTLLGEALQQSGGPFSASSLNGAAVLNLAGFFDVVLAQPTFDGAGNLTGTLEENNNGTTTANSPLTGTYSVDPDGLGRGVTTFAGDLRSYSFYLVRPGQGFLVDNWGRFGDFEPQTGGPFASTSLAGNYALGTLPSSDDYGLPDFTSGVAASDGSGDLQGAWDLPAGSDQSFTGTYSVGETGRTSVTIVPSGASSLNLVLYFISPSKAVAIDMTGTSMNARLIVIEK